MNARVNIRATTVDDDEQARDDELDAERAKLVKRLSVAFFCEAISEAEHADLAECVEYYKSGDTLLLGLAVKEIIAAYVEKCSTRTNRGSK
jgi:hypothetical protein